MDKSIHRLKSEGDINLSGERKAWQAEYIDGETREWLAEDEKYFFRQSLSTPCLDVLTECSGLYLKNMQGIEYMDFHGNNLHQAGFANPYIMDAVKNQMDTLPFSTRRFTNVKAIELAKKLAALSGGVLSKTLFMPSGALAVGTALKIAKAYTGKYKTISLWDSFHGASADSISVGGESLFRVGIGPLLPGAGHVPPPNTYRGIFADGSASDIKYAEFIEYVVEKEGDIAAIVAETVRNTDVIVPTREYWQKIREICDKHEILLIMDEIPISFGRTGKMFAYENFDIMPDLLCIGKALGGGIIPMAAVLGRPELDIFPEMAMGHYTHEKNPLGSAAGLAFLEYLENNDILGNVQKLEALSREYFADMKERYPIIGDVRGIGLLWGLELVTDREKKTPAFEAGEKIMYECLSKGLSFKVSCGNIITLAPPLIINEEQLLKAYDIIDMAIMKYSRI